MLRGETARTTFVRSKRPHYNRLAYFGALVFLFSKINGAPCAFKAEGARVAGRQVTVFCLKTSTGFTRIYFEDGATVERFPVPATSRMRFGHGVVPHHVCRRSCRRRHIVGPLSWRQKIALTKQVPAFFFAFDSVSFSISALQFCTKNVPLLSFQFCFHLFFSRCLSLRQPRAFRSFSFFFFCLRSNRSRPVETKPKPV